MAILQVKGDKMGISPVNSANFKSYVNFRANPSSKKGSFVAPKKPENKNNGEKKFSFKKVALGILAGAVLVEYILRRNPTRNGMIKEYGHIFSKAPDEVEKTFPKLSLREEAIAWEVINGNKCAKNLYPTVSKDVPEVVKYANTVKKIDSAKRLYIEGRFDIFHEGTFSNEETQQRFFDRLYKMRKSAREIAQKQNINAVHR